MPDYPLFPYSPTLDGFPVDEITGDQIRDIAETARQAFFAEVAVRLVDLYPGSTVYGDETPGETVDRDNVAYDWVMSHAWNSTAVQEYNGEPCSLSGLEAVDADGLFREGFPAGITRIDVEPANGLSLITVHGTRRAIVDFVSFHWDGTDDLEEWFADIVADTAKESE